MELPADKNCPEQFFWIKLGSVKPLFFWLDVIHNDNLGENLVTWYKITRLALISLMLYALYFSICKLTVCPSAFCDLNCKLFELQNLRLKGEVKRNSLFPVFKLFLFSLVPFPQPFIFYIASQPYGSVTVFDVTRTQPKLRARNLGIRKQQKETRILVVWTR